jgi:hypothetical protein
MGTRISVAWGQYRNAVASGQSRDSQAVMWTADPTLPRYGTDDLIPLTTLLTELSGEI